MNTNREIFIPVILGTPRQERISEYAAKLVVEVVERNEFETDLIDIRNIPLSTIDEGESIKNPEFSATVMRAGALIIVVPEYNYGYPGMLKHLLAPNLKEYIHKAAGICGVQQVDLVVLE